MVFVYMNLEGKTSEKKGKGKERLKSTTTFKVKLKTILRLQILIKMPMMKETNKINIFITLKKIKQIFTD